MTDGTLFGAARASFGFTDAAWRAFVLRWSGLDREDALYEDTPDGRRGSARVLDRLIVGGWMHPTAGYVSGDYCRMLLRLNGRGPGESAAMQTALRLADHPPAWTFFSVTGRTFHLVVGHYAGLGYGMPELTARQWMTPDRVAEVAEARRAAGVDERRFAGLLRDFGGGPIAVDQLDAAGFDRLLLALDVVATGDTIATAILPATVAGNDVPGDLVSRLWPDLARRAG